MKRSALILAAAASVGCAVNVDAGKLDGGLLNVLATTPQGEVVSALVFLWDQGDIDQLSQQLAAERAPIARRSEEVLRTLRDTAALTQQNLRRVLDRKLATGEVEYFEAFWIANCIRVDATADVLEAIAAHPDVMRVYYNPRITGVLPADDSDPIEGGIAGGPEPGLIAVRAPEVWNLGLTGEGIVVATLDTGVDGNHPAIASRWRGLDPEYEGNPGWAWFDPVTNTTFPQEFHWSSHGTHTMGTAVGGAPGDQIGVAPGAQWIHAAVVDRVNISTTVADAIQAFQWIVDPDGNPGTHWDVPHVCSNSWGLMTLHGYPQCDQTFWSFLDNAEAAGVIVTFAAGNESSTGLRRPADRATDEYRTMAVAAVNANNANWPLANFSALGPTNCTLDGSQAIKPDISAPGVSVRSSINGGGYGFKDGTSMAVPHIAGVMALMIEACPELTGDQIKQIIYDTAHDLGTPGKNNSYGWGMVDAYEAVLMAQAMCLPTLTLPDGAPNLLAPDEPTTFTVAFNHQEQMPVPGTELLYYRYDGGEFLSTPLSLIGDGVYEATLPAASCGMSPEYYVQLESDGGHVATSPANAPELVHAANVGVLNVIEILDENFGDGAPAGWNLTGLWHISQLCAKEADCPEIRWAYYGLSMSCSYTGSTVSGGAMSAAAVDIPEVNSDTTVVLQFCQDLEHAPGSGDVARVRINGQIIQELEPSGGWETVQLDITDFAGEAVTVSWEFAGSGSHESTGLGWQVDGVRLTINEITCGESTCPGDLTGTGEVDVFDLLQLLGAWGPCPGCAEDLNADGTVDVFDLLQLLSAWGACP